MMLNLHIGRPKSASSTIQGFILKNSQKLKDKGVHVPDFLGRGNNRLIYTLVNNEFGCEDVAFVRRGLESDSDKNKFCDRVFKKFRKWVASLPNSSEVIMSCEQLTSLSSKKIEYLKKLFDENFSEYRIIVYVRRQDLVFASRYNTALLSGLNSFYCGEFSYPADPPKNLCHYDLVERWSKVFGRGNMRLRTLDPSYLVDGSVARDFCSALSLDADDFSEDVGKENESVSGATLEAVRLLNEKLKSKGFSNYDAARVLRVIHNCSKLSEDSGGKFRPSAFEAKEFYAFYESKNDQLAKDYLGREELFSGSFDMYPKERSEFDNKEVLNAMLELTTSIFLNANVNFERTDTAED